MRALTLFRAALVSQHVRSRAIHRVVGWTDRDESLYYYERRLARTPASFYYLPVPDTAALHDLLHKHFGFREFLEGQEAVVESIVGGQDTLVIMPTGGGKSLCYQLPALALEGITVVVSPRSEENTSELQSRFGISYAVYA